MKRCLLAALVLFSLGAWGENRGRPTEKPQIETRVGLPGQGVEFQEEVQRLTAELENLRARADNAETTTATLQAENERLRSELIAIRQASANVLQIQDERDQLIKDKVSLENELETTKREKNLMDASSRQDWFLIGAGVLFGGIVLGLILPRLGWKKKSSWDTF